MKAVHVITGLRTGGAEVMLLRLLKQLQGSDYDPYVIGLTEPGEISEQIEALGIPVEALSMRRGVPNPIVAVKVAGILRRVQPDVVQTWMYHADLIGGLAARLAGNPPVAWGLHSGNISATVIKRQTLMIVRACARLSSSLPAAIVSCAESTRQQHVELGYAEDKMLVIPNGFDLNAFRPDPAARVAIRRELGLAENDRLVGIVARFHPQKDHKNFVEAAGIVGAHRDDTHFLFAGDDLTWENSEVAGWIDAAGIRSRCHLLGRRGDMARIQASLDVGCLSSQGGEAMPLTIGEAMASGVPCAVTDVGDAALLVGETGRVAPTGDPAALAAAIEGLLALSPEGRALAGEAARRRIAERYSLPSIADRYVSLHERLALRSVPVAA